MSPGGEATHDDVMEKHSDTTDAKDTEFVFKHIEFELWGTLSPFLWHIYIYIYPYI